jgi:hypothetical protein
MTTRPTAGQVKKHGWPMHVVFTENDDETRADIVLDVEGHHYHGWGWARRNPIDPSVPRIGEEIAAARALNRLARQMLDAAAEEIEGFEGHPVWVPV